MMIQDLFKYFHNTRIARLLHHFGIFLVILGHVCIFCFGSLLKLLGLSWWALGNCFCMFGISWDSILKGSQTILKQFKTIPKLISRALKFNLFVVTGWHLTTQRQYKDWILMFVFSFSTSKGPTLLLGCWHFCFHSGHQKDYVHARILWQPLSLWKAGRVAQRLMLSHSEHLQPYQGLFGISLP